MIYNYLKGGLGNILFQIASTKSMSIDLGCECSFPNLQSHLHYLNNETTFNPKINYCLEYNLFLEKLKVEQPKENTQRCYFPFHYDPIKISDDIIIDGFFQSEKYFIKNRKEILEFIDLSSVCHTYVKEKYNFLKEKTTSIHIRRGDYVNYPSHHPTQSIEYYNQGVEILNDETDLFVIFSDDIQWCKDNLKLENVVYIENEKDYIELYLMSLCDNNIISNSSFSWWGAWLNNNPNKIVIGPKIWFGDSINHNTNDIIPENWIKI
jgi:hypothetical protein